MRPYGQGPGSPYKFLVDGHWPDLAEDDPFLRRSEAAYREATMRTIAYRPSRGAPLEFIDPGRPDPLRGPDVRPLVAITCLPARHNRHRPPTLATVWQTSLGPLFIAQLSGHLLNPGEVPGSPFDPPAAVRNWRASPPPSRELEPPTGGWRHVPTTIVRLLLTDDVPAKLWVKCVDHGPAEVNRAALFREYDGYLKKIRGSDTPEPCVLRLDSVAALSST